MFLLGLNEVQIIMVTSISHYEWELIDLNQL